MQECQFLSSLSPLSLVAHPGTANERCHSQWGSVPTSVHKIKTIPHRHPLETRSWDDPRSTINTVTKPLCTCASWYSLPYTTLQLEATGEHIPRMVHRLFSLLIATAENRGGGDKEAKRETTLPHRLTSLCSYRVGWSNGSLFAKGRVEDENCSKERREGAGCHLAFF